MSGSVPVMLVDHDPNWTNEFEVAAAAITAIEPSWLIEHIGSTSIDQMPAKPIIDLAVRVASFDELDRRVPELEAIGWQRIRDWLRGSPDDRRRYLEVKRQAAAEVGPGRAYTARKSAIVEEITNRARAARGLEPVDTWDK